ncbi:Probable RNA-directed DNA polymerase from transposon BS [Eumeta japonica]|uniref:Probable RNA-directed DNA polymerase from transposon BS n=1 Tax=Eumeta variegata TaxID=151549 RepID=A0A4C1U0X4_EUMVA|nr:Probable RNA-directed DNA polymerase from transposon BS [Eumeta japonica]
MGPPDGGRPIPFRKITNWKRVSTALEKIDTPNLNSIPNDIASTDEIDLAIGALTNHVRTVVEESEREVPASSDRRKFPPDILELIRAKTQLCAARAYPTPEYRSRRELSNANYQSAQNRGYTLYPHSKPDNSEAIDDAEIAECLADSIETQCSHASPPHDIAHISRIEEEASTSQETTRPPASYRPISLLSGLGKLFEKILKTRLSDHLLGKGFIIDEQFGFRPAHSCPQQVLRLVEYVSEGFETERSTVAVFFDVAKAFDRVWHAGLIYKLYSLQVPDRLIITIQNYLANRHFTFRHERTHSTRRLIRAGVPQGSTVSPLLYSAYTNDVPRPSSSGVQLALFADDTALFYGNRNRSTRFTLLPLQRAIDELGQWFRKWRIEVNPDKSAAIQFKTVMTYASPVFAHAAPKALHRLQVIQNKFCRAATDAHWCVRNSILHRDLELPTISKYMKDASKRFFDIAGSHPNALLRAAVDYQPPHPTYPQVIDLSSLLHPAAANRLRPGRRKGTDRDGFLRHPMPRRLPPGVVHSACHAPSALACAVRPHSDKIECEEFRKITIITNLAYNINKGASINYVARPRGGRDKLKRYAEARETLELVSKEYKLLRIKYLPSKLSGKIERDSTEKNIDTLKVEQSPDMEKSSKNEVSQPGNVGNKVISVVLTAKDGQKLVVPSNSYHGIASVEGKTRCALCNVYVKYVNVHKVGSKHLNRLKSCVHIENWAENLIRELNSDKCHCTICNVTINKIQVAIHIDDAAHKEELKRALSKGSVYEYVY